MLEVWVVDLEPNPDNKISPIDPKPPNPKCETECLIKA